MVAFVLRRIGTAWRRCLAAGGACAALDRARSPLAPSRRGRSRFTPRGARVSPRVRKRLSPRRPPFRIQRNPRQQRHHADSDDERGASTSSTPPALRHHCPARSERRLRCAGRTKARASERRLQRNPGDPAAALCLGTRLCTPGSTGGGGLEPPLPEPESGVLPKLHQPPLGCPSGGTHRRV